MTERSFAAALKFHMDRGTRPIAGLHGRPWTIAELATVVGCSDKIVSVWLNGGIPSRKNVFEVELALFGEVPAENPGEIGRWRTEFRAAADRERRLLSRLPSDDENALANEKVDAPGETRPGSAQPETAAPPGGADAQTRHDPSTLLRRPALMAAGAIAVLLVAIVIATATMTGQPEIPVSNAGVGIVPTQDSGLLPPAYSVVEIEVTDPQLFIQFAQQLGPAIIAAGGRSLTLPVAAQVLHEGEAPKGIGITVWPNVEAAAAFYTSAAFLNLLPLRDRAANIVRLVTIVGLPLPEGP